MGGSIRYFRAMKLPSLLLLVFACGVLEAVAETRTWTSSTGETLEGAMESATDRSVVVRRSDGRQFDIALSKLSEIDQDFVRSHIADAKRREGLSEGEFAEGIIGEWVKIPAEKHGILFQIYGDETKLKRLKEPFPLFLHLHGAASRGADVETGKVEIAAHRLSTPEIYDKHPCLIVVPTCPADTNWGDHAETLESLVDTFTSALPIDRSRIYLSGYSMGARGIAKLIERRPKFYAAALFADGEANSDWVEWTDTALWMTFSGERDLEGARAVADAYAAAGKPVRFEGYPDHTHNQIHWTLAKTEGVYDWCFEQTRK